jgi:hypothetical protein
MPKKLRCSSCSTGWCKNHVFEINPLSTSLYYKRNFKIRLCPRLNKYLYEFIRRQSNKFEKIIPLLNSDKKFYTPSFYLEEEKVKNQPILEILQRQRRTGTKKSQTQSRIGHQFQLNHCTFILYSVDS